uniref:Alkyl transferase n=1 Tax=Chenopodium quinoa TaxID=63459 RepID=A0A803LXC3_CHEQI
MKGSFHKLLSTTSDVGRPPALANEEVELPPGLQREAMPRHVAVIMDGNVRWAKQRGLHGSAGQRLPFATVSAAPTMGPAVAVEEELPPGLRHEAMPRHVAVIMDGNVRWARQRGLPSGAGHEAGVRSLRRMVELCGKWGVKVLTVFAFSYDNWVRPQVISYSGKYDIIQACKNISQKVKDGAVEVEEIDEGLIEQELETNCTEYPYPDLLIRTSGELRVSNFLLWQLAYTELFFVRALWPDFGEEEFIEALMSYQQRSRRYGGRDLQESSANSR